MKSAGYGYQMARYWGVSSSVATLISVPRDFWVYLPPFEGRGGYWGKINEAYSVGMGKVDREVQHVPYKTHEKGGTLAARVTGKETP